MLQILYHKNQSHFSFISSPRRPMDFIGLNLPRDVWKLHWSLDWSFSIYFGNNRLFKQNNRNIHRLVNVLCRWNYWTFFVGISSKINWIFNMYGFIIIFISFQASTISHLFVFIIIGCSHALAVLYSLFLVPNIPTPRVSDPNAAKPINCQSLFSLIHLKESFSTCFVRRTSEARFRLIILLVMAMVVMITTTGELDIAFLYLSDNPLKVPFNIFSYWFGTRYGLSSLMLLVGLPILKHFGVKDWVICAFLKLLDFLFWDWPKNNLWYLLVTLLWIIYLNWLPN